MQVSALDWWIGVENSHLRNCKLEGNLSKQVTAKMDSILIKIGSYCFEMINIVKGGEHSCC